MAFLAKVKIFKIGLDHEHAATNTALGGTIATPVERFTATIAKFGRDAENGAARGALGFHRHLLAPKAVKNRGYIAL